MLFLDRYNSDTSTKILKELDAVAKENNANLAQLALAWAIRNKDVSTAILGAKTKK